MPRFRYQAVDATGRRLQGVVEAGSEAEVARAVHAQGNTLLRADPPGWRAVIRGLLHADLGAERGIGKKTVAWLTRELAVMLGSGQDIDHALRFMVETAPDP